jgi:hypothetical protein
MKRSSKRWRRTGVAIAFAAVAIGVGLYARAGMNVPAGIAYSGLLRNNGVPDSGAHTFAFDLLDDKGNPLCATDMRTSLTITNGRFDVPNLFSSCAGLDDLLATKAGLRIRITVDSMVLSPDQPIGTVPFAAHARVAESATSFVTGSLDIVAPRGLTANGVPGMIFGGMYCTDNAATPGGSPGGEMTIHVNPLTNARSCPPGFTPYVLFETGDVATCSSTCGGFKCYYCGR